MDAKYTLGWLPVMVAAITSLSPANTIIVHPAGGGDFSEIQPAIDAALEGDTVLVKPGEYIIDEPINFNRLHDPGDPGSPSVKNISLRSSDGSALTIIRMADPPRDPARASVVLFWNGETAASSIEGFTLTGGTGTCPRGGTSATGGGILCLDSSPQIIECDIVENVVLKGRCGGDPGTGGVYCDSTTDRIYFPALLRCRISRNVGYQAGGISSGWCDLSVVDCIISENIACAAIEDGNIFARENGGVLLSRGSPRLTRCRISGNVASFGGGICIGGQIGNPVVEDCWITGNEGGGILFRFSTFESARIENCVIAGNRGGHGAGGSALRCHMSDAPTLINCTITGNRTLLSRDTPEVVGQSPTRRVPLLNCIVWPDLTADVERTTSLTDRDPGFLRPPVFELVEKQIVIRGMTVNMPDYVRDLGDLRLTSDSPALDAGTAAGAPEADILGEGRPCGAGVDIGAFERCAFVRGDANVDGRVDVADAMPIVKSIFAGEALRCAAAADTNHDARLDAADAVFLLNFLFRAGLRPPAPFPSCALAAIGGGLPCEEFPPCR